MPAPREAAARAGRECGWAGGGRAELCPERDPRSVSAAPGPRPLPRAPLAEPARPPSPASREPPELPSEPSRAGAAGAGTRPQRSGVQGAGTPDPAAPTGGCGLAAPPGSSSSGCRQGPSLLVAGGCRPRDALAPESPRRGPERVSGGALARAGSREGADEGVHPSAGPALACLPCSPRTGPQPSPAPAGGRVQGRCAGCAGGASGGGGSGGRGSCRNPLSWPIGLAAPSGRRGVTSEINRRPGQAAGRLRARGELGARRGRLQTFAVCASPELVSVLLRARGRSRGAQLFPRNDSVSPPSPGASG